MRSIAQFPGKMLAYNCSPSFNWQKKLPAEKIASFQRDMRVWDIVSNSSHWPGSTA